MKRKKAGINIKKIQKLFQKNSKLFNALYLYFIEIFMLSYSTLREIQKKEIEGGPLVELEEDFFQKAVEYLKSKKQETISGNILSIKEYENAKRVLSIILSKREEKIILMALRSEKSQIGLVEKEQELFLKLQNIIAEHRKNSLLDEETEFQMQKVVIEQEVGKYMGSDKKLYGPFKKGEEHLLPKSEVEWLLKEKMAQYKI